LMSEEGLESTENELIHIGKPMDFDEDEFIKELNNLYKEAYAETEEMKEIVHRIVPTYNRRQEDITRDKELQDSLKSDFPDTRSHLPNEFLKVGVN
ncbi:MAG: polysaccharide biosynthesis protein, partial [Eubacteriales bacterium]